MGWDLLRHVSIYFYFVINVNEWYSKYHIDAIYSVNSEVSVHSIYGINHNLYHRNTFLKCNSVKDRDYYLAGAHLKK